jgi:cytochrome c-type biogenesis protein CcmH/NrfF
MQVVKIEMKCARCRSQWIASSRSSLAVDSSRVDSRLAFELIQSRRLATELILLA